METIEINKWGNDANCHHPDSGCGCGYPNEAPITLSCDDAHALIELLDKDNELLANEVVERLMQKLKNLTETEND